MRGLHRLDELAGERMGDRLMDAIAFRPRALDGRDNARTGDWIGQWVRFAKMRRVRQYSNYA